MKEMPNKLHDLIPGGLILIQGVMISFRTMPRQFFKEGRVAMFMMKMTRNSLIMEWASVL